MIVLWQLLRSGQITVLQTVSMLIAMSGFPVVLLNENESSPNHCGEHSSRGRIFSLRRLSYHSSNQIPSITALSCAGAETPLRQPACMPIRVLRLPGLWDGQSNDFCQIIVSIQEPVRNGNNVDNGFILDYNFDSISTAADALGSPPMGTQMENT